MSYTVLALKWRPRRFEALVGQTDVVKALENSLAAGRLHHAYLFSGTRGVGKTTVARILAKALNCEQGVSAEPCGVCGACADIDAGRFVDLIEVDAASRTRVDDTRELLDNVQYMPTRGRFKVYLIDEVHMLSTHSFNALLKTLEEPPPHVKFLLATTDPQKLPVTVLSRCLQFNLKKLTPGLIQDQLATILVEEGVTAESEALRAIARSANGSMRDALSLLDQAIAFGGGTVAAADVSQMLGSIDRSQVVAILEALAANNGQAMLAQVDQLDELGVDFGSVLDELLASLQQIAVVQLVPDRNAESDSDWEDLAGKLHPEDVQLYYQLALTGRRDMAWSRDERMSFEMTLLRMLAFRLDAPVAASSSKAGRTTTSSARPAAPQTSSTRRSPPRARAEKRSEEPTRTQPAAPQEAPPSKAEPVADWQALVQSAGLRGAVRNLADHCELSSDDGYCIELVLQQDKANFNTDQLRSRLEEALGSHLRRKLLLKVVPGQPPRATPAQVRQANEDQRFREAREAIEQDPNIQAVQAAFDAVLEPDSIQPASPKS